MSLSFDSEKNIMIEYDVASTQSRIFATLIDYVVFTLYLLISYPLIAALFHPRGASGRLAVGIGIGLPIMLYDLVLEMFNNGQSIGKKLMKLQVVRLEGGRPGTGQFLVRWITRLFDRSWIAVIAVAVSDKGQRIGDRLASTKVINLKETVSLQGTIFDAERRGGGQDIA